MSLQIDQNLSHDDRNLYLQGGGKIPLSSIACVYESNMRDESGVIIHLSEHLAELPNADRLFISGVDLQFFRDALEDNTYFDVLANADEDEFDSAVQRVLVVKSNIMGVRTENDRIDQISCQYADDTFSGGERSIFPVQLPQDIALELLQMFPSIDPVRDTPVVWHKPELTA